MIESIEGKRGLPRHRPPYVAEVGLFGRPTLNHNVETLYWIRDIVEKGPQWFADRRASPAIRRALLVGVGPRQEPGRQAGAGRRHRARTDRRLLRRHGRRPRVQGLSAGRCLGRYPAGLDGRRAARFRRRLDKLGAFVGSHAIVVFSDKDDIKDVALNLLHFFEDESCGQCTPCRERHRKDGQACSTPGTSWTRPALRDLRTVMRDASICGLGQAAPNPVNHLLTAFSRRTFEMTEQRIDLHPRRTNRSRPSPARPSGRSPSARARRSRICAMST